MLLLFSWTASYAQMQDSHKDSTISYTDQELRVISLKLIEGNECSEVLNVREKQLKVADSIITSQKSIIRNQKIQVYLSDSVITKQKDVITNLNSDLSKSNNKLKWTKVGWISTTVLIVSLWIYSLYR